MTHRAEQLLDAVHAALPGSDLMPTAPPAVSKNVILFGGTEPEGGLAPNTMGRVIYRLTVQFQMFVYEEGAEYKPKLFQLLSDAHRATMAAATFAALDFYVGTWIGPVGEPEFSTETERAHAVTQAEFYIDYWSDPDNPEV